MGGTPRGKDKPGPSYEDGALRDPEITRRQVDSFDGNKMAALVKKAAKVENQSRLS